MPGGRGLCVKAFLIVMGVVFHQLMVPIVFVVPDTPGFHVKITVTPILLVTVMAVVTLSVFVCVTIATVDNFARLCVVDLVAVLMKCVYVITLVIMVLIVNQRAIAMEIVPPEEIVYVIQVGLGPNVLPLAVLVLMLIVMGMEYVIALLSNVYAGNG